MQGCGALKYPFDYGPALSEDPGRILFDFIVVGGGSAGTTVAARLSEVPEWNVLLLEAGNDPPELTENPLAWNQNLRTEIDWAFWTEKNPNMFRGMEDQRCLMSRGMTLGGSSSINAMIYLRGTEEDFRWWETNGCPGWGYGQVLPYFMKSEDFVDAGRFDPEIHAADGPLTVSPLETFDPAYGVVAEALRSLGVTATEDFARETIGYGNFDSSTRDGRRCSTLKAFLLPASDRPNLYVAKNTLVTRVMIADGTAVGVEFVTASAAEYKSVYCSREVVLSAGPVKSPQILMLSGIGPRGHLQSLGVPVVQNSPVGFNLQDHMSFPGLVFTDRKYRSKEAIVKESWQLLEKELSLYPRNVATLGVSKLMTFIKSNARTESPDLQIIQFRVPYNATNAFPNGKNAFSNMFGYGKQVTTVYDQLNSLSDILVFVPIMLKLSSTGRVMLRSNDRLDRPRIFADFLTNEEEIETLLDGIDFVVKLSKTRAMTDAGFVLEELKLPDCSDHAWGTRPYWLCAIRNIAAPFYHCVGTCKMGSANDPTTVVDPLLRVKGVRGLRVIDSSVMPRIVSVNTNAATIMIAEKGSDIVKNHHKNLQSELSGSSHATNEYDFS